MPGIKIISANILQDRMNFLNPATACIVMLMKAKIRFSQQVCQNLLYSIENLCKMTYTITSLKSYVTEIVMFFSKLYSYQLSGMSVQEYIASSLFHIDRLKGDYTLHKKTDQLSLHVNSFANQWGSNLSLMSH